MSNTLQALQMASIKPVYAVIDLADQDASREGKIRVRVNLTKAMRREMQAAQDNQDDNEAGLRLLAQLIPRDDTSDTPLTYDELKQFIEGGDDEEELFVTWFINAAFEKVREHFLAKAAR